MNKSFKRMGKKIIFFSNILFEFQEVWKGETTRNEAMFWHWLNILLEITHLIWFFALFWQSQSDKQLLHATGICGKKYFVRKQCFGKTTNFEGEDLDFQVSCHDILALLVRRGVKELSKLLLLLLYEVLVRIFEA